ncbi:hypothetical protein ACFSM7_02140 [Clavibacter michiganensis subsp. tessellarius]
MRPSSHRPLGAGARHAAREPPRGRPPHDDASHGPPAAARTTPGRGG